MALRRGVEDESEARSLAHTFIGLVDSRTAWLHATAGPSAELDGSPESLDRLAAWFCRQLDAGVPGLPTGDRAVYAKAAGRDTPRRIRATSARLQAYGRARTAEPTTDPRIRSRADLLAEVIAGYAAEVCRQFDPGFRWAMAPVRPGYRPSGLASLVSGDRWVDPLTAGATFCDLAAYGIRDDVDLRRNVLWALNDVGLGPPRPPSPVNRPTGPRPRVPLWARFDPLERIMNKQLDRLYAAEARSATPVTVGEPDWESETIAVGREDHSEWTHSIQLCDDLAHRDDLVEALVGYLSTCRGVREVHHEDREVLILRAPRVKVAVLGEITEAWVSQHFTPSEEH